MRIRCIGNLDHTFVNAHNVALQNKKTLKDRENWTENRLKQANFRKNLYRQWLEKWIIKRDGSMEKELKLYEKAKSKWSEARKSNSMLCGFGGTWRATTKDEKTNPGRCQFKTAGMSKACGRTPHLY